MEQRERSRWAVVEHCSWPAEASCVVAGTVPGRAGSGCRLLEQHDRLPGVDAPLPACAHSPPPSFWPSTPCGFL